MVIRIERLILGFAILSVILCACLSSVQAEDGTPGSYQGVASRADEQRTKVVEVLMKKLEKLKPQGKLEKAVDDFYVLGTSDVNVRSRHAEVRFSAKQGQQDVAEFLADYILAQPNGMIRQWYVFYRVKGPDQAQQALVAVRNQYDQAQRYQIQMQKIYNARAQAYRNQMQAYRSQMQRISSARTSRRC